jgi:hypothetical protein
MASSSTLLLGSAAIAAATVGYIAYSHGATLSSGTDDAAGALTDIDEETDFITEDDVTQVFSRLFMEVQQTFNNIMQQLQQLQMAGQQLNETQVKMILKSELDRAIKIRYLELLKMYGDIEESCFEEATWEFLRDPVQYPSVDQEVTRFQKLWERMVGQPVSGWRPWNEEGSDQSRTTSNATGPSPDLAILSPERTVQMAQVYFDSLIEHMRSCIAEMKKKDPSVNFRNPATGEQLHNLFAPTAQDAGEAALQAHGSTLDQFQLSVSAHAEIPSVGRALGVIQIQHQQQMQGLALS